MDLRSGKRLLSLVYNLFMETGRHPAQIPYSPQKTESFLHKRAEPYFPAVTPEEVGISSRTVEAFLHALEEQREANVNSVLVLRQGKLFCEASAGAYSTDIWHLTHSLCKTVTGLAVGILSDEGKIRLSDLVSNYFPEYTKTFGKSRIKAVTLRHLLMMGVENSFQESGSLIEENWVRGYMTGTVKEEPGTTFSYNSMSSYLLSAVIQKVTGETMFDYLQPRLFDPMGIRNVFWEKSPEGITKGGWGLYISPEDMAKLGMLLLQDGVWEGKRLISHDYLREMTSVQNHPAKSFGAYDYGYQVWVDGHSGNLLFNGMLGQDILVVPKTETVVVLTAGNSELFQHSKMLKIAEKYFAGEAYAPSPLPPDKKAYRSLTAAAISFYDRRQFAKPLPEPGIFRKIWAAIRQKDPRPLPPECDNLAGQQFDFPRNNCGVLPLFVTLMQNNFSDGIREIHFAREEGAFVLYITEGTALYRLPVGFYAPAFTEIDLHGEKYLIAVSGSFRKNEDDIPILKLDFAFPELPGARHLKLYYTEPVPMLTVTEEPGYAIAEPFIQKLADHNKGLLGMLFSMISPEMLKEKVKRGFNPILQLSRHADALPEPEAEASTFWATVPEEVTHPQESAQGSLAQKEPALTLPEAEESRTLYPEEPDESSEGNTAV